MFSSRVDLEAGDSLFAALHALGDLEALTGAFVFSVCDSYHCWHCWKCGCGDGPRFPGVGGVVRYGGHQ